MRYQDNYGSSQFQRARQAVVFSVRRWLVLEVICFWASYSYYIAQGDPNGIALIGAAVIGLPLGFVAWLAVSLLLFVGRR